MKFTFNRPKLYIPLLSDGSTHEVYSTVLTDEFTLRTPDALLNGLATEQVIQNCCPDIIDFNKIYICDIPQILGSIKIASGQSELEFSMTCPNCQNSENYEFDLLKFIPYLSSTKWKTPLELDKLIIYLSPPSYREFSIFSLEDFRLDKQLYQLKEIGEIGDNETRIINLMEQKRKLTLDFQCRCISKICTIDNFTITERKFIDEYFNQIDMNIQTQITNHIEEANKQCRLPEMNVTCQECKNSIMLPMDLDFSSIFRRRLVAMSEEEILTEFSNMSKESKRLTDETLKMIWYMRGAISYSEAMNLTVFERECITKIIDGNIEVTKKSGISFV